MRNSTCVPSSKPRSTYPNTPIVEDRSTAGPWPASSLYPTPTNADLERFEELVGKWKRETLLMSSPAEITNHPAYRDIISMGPMALPWIFSEMRLHGGHWYAALREITKTDPVEAADAGDMVRMAKAWLEWGAVNGY